MNGPFALYSVVTLTFPFPPPLLRAQLAAHVAAAHPPTTTPTWVCTFCEADGRPERRLFEEYERYERHYRFCHKRGEYRCNHESGCRFTSSILNIVGNHFSVVHLQGGVYTPPEGHYTPRERTAGVVLAAAVPAAAPAGGANAPNRGSHSASNETPAAAPAANGTGTGGSGSGGGRTTRSSLRTAAAAAAEDGPSPARRPRRG